ASFLAGPLVSRAFLMRGLAALARDLALLVPVHRSKSAILFSHGVLPPGSASASRVSPHSTLALRGCVQYSGCNAGATRKSVSLSHTMTSENLFRSARSTG